MFEKRGAWDFGEQRRGGKIGEVNLGGVWTSDLAKGLF